MLERFHGNVSLSDDSIPFLVSISDYVEYTLNNKEIHEIIKNLTLPKDKLRNDILKNEHTTLLELKRSADKIRDIIKRRNIDSKELNELFNEIDRYYNKNVSTSNVLSDAISIKLLDVISELRKVSPTKILETLIKEGVIIQSYDRYILSSALIARQKQTKEITNRRTIEIWGNWDRLFLVYTLISKGANSALELVGKEKDFNQPQYTKDLTDLEC